MNQLENLFSDQMWSNLHDAVMSHRTSETVEFLTTIRNVAEDYAASDFNGEF